jgi:hypothetical protein
MRHSGFTTLDARAAVLVGMIRDDLGRLNKAFSTTARHSFHPGGCKYQQGITHQSSITPSGTATAVNPQS